MVVVPDIGVNKTKLKSSSTSEFIELIAISPAFKEVAFTVIASNKNIEYFDIAIDNENSKKTFYLNNFFSPAGSSLGNVLKNDKKWNLSRRIFIQFFNFNPIN